LAQREWVVENDISGPDGEAERAGWLVWKMQIIGKRGCPDRWHFRRDHPKPVIIEYKKRGEKPDGIQRKRHDELRGQGYEVHVVVDHDHARKLLKLGAHA